MSMERHSLMPSRVLVAYDATRDGNEQELKHIVSRIRSRGGILHGGDTIIMLGVLHRVHHPMGYPMQAVPESFMGTSIRAIEEEVSKKVDAYVNTLLKSAEACKEEGVDIEVKITAGAPLKKVVQQEVTICNATWVVLDRNHIYKEITSIFSARHLRRDLRFYLKQIPCKVALVLDNLTVEVLKPQNTTDTDNTEHKMVLSMSKPVPLSIAQDDENTEESVISCRSYTPSFSSLESFNVLRNTVVSSLMNMSRGLSSSSTDIFHSTPKQSESPFIPQKQQKTPRRQRSSDAPILCVACGMTTQLYIRESMRFSHAEIQLATDDFSKENLLGEGGYGLVYKGELNDGQLIAAKVRKEASTQGFTEFHTEVYVLSFARHKNIVMLLGYCCKENVNILIYEYICNMSLEWHLFDKTANVLEWHRRHAIALGIAKGLRFLHEECRSGPIIHRDLRPSNILLTHDFVPMLGDFGLAKWKINDSPIQTRILGTLGYLAPEYAENGIVSVRTDVYAFGVVLIQLISGCKAVDSNREDQQSLRQWAESIIERLALHELIDPRLGDSYDTHELYRMAKAAYFCVKIDPEMRPSMGEVVRLLEGENHHLHRVLKNWTKALVPNYMRLDARASSHSSL